jgi:hypothetical protein
VFRIAGKDYSFYRVSMGKMIQCLDICDIRIFPRYVDVAYHASTCYKHMHVLLHDCVENIANGDMFLFHVLLEPNKDLLHMLVCFATWACLKRYNFFYVASFIDSRKKYGNGCYMQINKCYIRSIFAT